MKKKKIEKIYGKDFGTTVKRSCIYLKKKGYKILAKIFE